MLSREGIIQFLANLATLSAFTYIPVWGRLINLSDPEIALTATLYGLVAFSSGVISGRLSDLIGVRKVFVIIGSFAAAVTLFGLITSHKVPFILFRALSGIGLGMFAPALVALVSDKGDKIGNFSAYGSFGWAVGVLVSGIIGLFWIPGIFIFGAFALLGATVIAFTLTEEESSGKKFEKSVPIVFWERKEVYFALTIRHSFASAIWVFWSLFLIDLGADTFWIAVIQCTNAFTQTIIMTKFTDKLDSQKMVAWGLILSCTAFISFTIPSSFYGIIPLQIILGLSWALLYVGTLRSSVEKSSFDKSTAAGIITSILPVANLIGSFIALLIISVGGSYIDIMIVATLATFIVFCAFLFVEKGTPVQFTSLTLE
ncbi:MAG: MFS transporter [Candidatus Heimdallarchaeota archaeon]|nr:MAG: MFS transporter [Candidatus Heimdallarchaeota archaeon]